MSNQHSDQPLAGRVAVVTGASAGIGEATARDFAANGAAVVLNARRRERLEAVAREIEGAGGRAAVAPGDCAETGVIESMLDAAGERFGAEADIVVANAGRGLGGSVTTSDESQWEEMIRTNYVGVVRLLRAASERLVGGAGLAPPEAPCARARDIVILGSNVGKHVSPFSSMYGSTKFAVGAIAEGARRELGPRGVRVSLVAPGIVATEFQRVAGYSDELVGGFRDKFGPLLTPDDVARLVTFIVRQPPHVHINDALIRPTRQDYP